MTELVTTERRDLAKMTLDQLAFAANAEHQEGRRKAGEALEHMIQTGQFLLEARSRFMREVIDSGKGGRIQRGEWKQWLETNFEGSVKSGAACQRLAFYQQEIRSAGIQQVRPAMSALAGLPPVGEEDFAKYGDEMRQKARRLYANGRLSQREVGRILGVTHQTVSRWVNPHNEAQYRKRQQERLEQKLAETRKRRLRTIAKRKDPVSDAYSMIRKLTQLVDQGRAEVHDQEGKEALRRAESLLHQADAAIVKALGLK